MNNTFEVKERKVGEILDCFKLDELAFIINLFHYGDSPFESYEEIAKCESKTKGHTLDYFKETLELVYKAGTGGKKDDLEKIAQRLKNSVVNCVDYDEFFRIIKITYEDSSLFLNYLANRIIRENSEVK